MLKYDNMTAGYLDGIKGCDPDHTGGSYEKGYLLGYAAKEAGQTLPKFHGYMDEKELPIKPGMTITITKGTIVKTVYKDPKPAGKTYKVKVNHILPGSGMYESGGFNSQIVPMRNPLVRWAGPGGYWSEVDMNEVPEAFSE